MQRISGNLDHHKFQGFQNSGDCIRIISVDPEERPNQELVDQCQKLFSVFLEVKRVLKEEELEDD